MTITEFAIVPLHSPSELSNPTLHTIFQTLSDWQSASSGFPLHFFTDKGDPRLIHLVSGWTSVDAHEAWIRGERNQTLMRVFGPYVDVKGVRMVHVDVDFGRVPTDGGLVVERYQSDQEGAGWTLFGRDLGESGDVYRFVGEAEGLGDCEVGPVASERWVLKSLSITNVAKD